MERNIFLSFRPEYFRPILYGIKKYEYRKRFCKEPVIAYLYLSSPVQEVIGKIKFEKPLMTKELLDVYSNNKKIKSRLLRCLENKEQYIIPIVSLQLFENPVTICDLKKINHSFTIPQCYCNLEKQKDIFEYLQSRTLLEREFLNDHSKVFEQNLGVLCIEMEETEEYIKKDNIFRNNPKYQKIKCSSLKERKH